MTVLAASLACATSGASAGGARAGAQFPEAEARLEKWGLRVPRTTQVVVHQSVEEFRRATGQRDPRLRAWTRYDVVHFYGPATEDRMVHELCHASIHQAFGDVERAQRAAIPRFFEEGACAIVAGQTRPMDRDAMLVRADASKNSMPIDIATFERDPELAYAASFAVMQHVLDQHGRKAFAEIVESARSDGSPGCVERAIKERTGKSPDELWAIIASM